MRQNRWRLPIGVGTVAATAAVILAVATLISVERPALGSRRSNTTGHHRQTIAVPVPTSIQSMTITDDTPVQRIWTLKSPKKTEGRVLAWLKYATPCSVKMPASHVILPSYVGPAQLHMTTAGQKSFIIAPANSIIDNHGLYQPKYIQNVTSVIAGNQTTYLRSPELYAWLKDSQWKNECAPPDNPVFDTTLRLPNGEVATPSHSVVWAGLQISLQVQSLPPVQPSYKSVVGNHSTVRSHTTVSTSVGPATLVLNERPAPAASPAKTPVYEYWVITDRNNYAYAIEAVVKNNRRAKQDRSTVMKLLQNWKVPN